MKRALLYTFLLSTVGCDGASPSDAGVDAGTDAGGTGRAPCSADAAIRDGNVARGLTSVCADGLIFTGFGIRWDDGAHRVARWAVFPRIGPEHFPDGCPDSSDLRGADLTTELTSGPESSGAGAEVRATYHVIGAGRGTDADAGTFAGLRMGRGEQVIDLAAQEEREVPALFDLALADLSGAPHVAVVLDGLELETDVGQTPEYPTDYDPAHGYSSRGIGAWIAGVERDGDMLAFTLGVRFALGSRDRPAMNAAIPVARTRAVVRYAVVALDREPARAAIDYREQHRGHGDADLAVCKPEPDRTALSIDGAPELNAAPGIAGFSISIFPDEEGVGDDLHELSFLVREFAFDRPSGRAEMRVEGYATNEGPPRPFRPMDYEVEADILLLQWSGDAPGEELSFSASIETGRTDHVLPLTR